MTFRPLDPKDTTLLSLWNLIYIYPLCTLQVQKANRKFYEAAKLDIKRLYGVDAKDITLPILSDKGLYNLEGADGLKFRN